MCESGKKASANSVPEPHPLDFDWRYTLDTAVAIGGMLPMSAPVLAVGAPSLARYLARSGRDVMLVDRQPFQSVEQHLSVEISDATPRMTGYRVAAVDPPWYPSALRMWLAWTAQSVGVGGEILATVWPAWTRPTADSEYGELLHWLGQWANFEELSFSPIYEVPPFELNAEQAAAQHVLSRSPRVGRLLRLTVIREPLVPAITYERYLWLRVVLNDYQLALRLSSAKGEPEIVEHPQAKGWRWPYVSARAPDRCKIDLWSSRNEVAVVTDAMSVAATLTRLLAATDQRIFDEEMRIFPQLSSWELPRPPYWRASQWSHRQSR